MSDVLITHSTTGVGGGGDKDRDGDSDGHGSRKSTAKQDGTKEGGTSRAEERRERKCSLS